MDKKSYNTLTYKHISESTDEILKYIDNRRKGFDRSLRTRWDKFNDKYNGGFEANCVYTIAGKRHMPALNS
jgi:hypothetical protein